MATVQDLSKCVDMAWPRHFYAICEERRVEGHICRPAHALGSALSPKISKC